MSRSPAIDLLAELRERGIELAVDGERLRFRPVEAVPPELRARMSRLKPELIALLAPRTPTPAPENPEEPPIPEYGDGDRPTVKRCPICRERDFTRPVPRGMWCCAKCHPYEGYAASDVECWPKVTAVESMAPSDDFLDPSPDPRPSNRCRCCQTGTFWRLKPLGPWVCARCHPPPVPAEAIETVTVAPEETGS